MSNATARARARHNAYSQPTRSFGQGLLDPEPEPELQDEPAHFWDGGPTDDDRRWWFEQTIAAERAAAEAAAPPPARKPRGLPGDPTTGRALYAWLKQQELETEYPMVKYLNSWAKLQDDWPQRIIDWSPDLVELALVEARRKLETTFPCGQGRSLRAGARS